MNKKGQALIEFVILLPIFILLLFGIIDFGRIYYTKIELQGKLDDVVKMHELEKDYNSIKRVINLGSDNDIELSISESDTTTIKLTTTINIFTPGLDTILSDPYEIKASRTYLNE